MNILDNGIESYLNDVIPDRDSVLTAMEEYATQNNFPIVGPLVGRLLYVLAYATKAKRVLELGSGFGYSAYWFAKAVGNDGIVLCTDKNPENEKKAKAYFKRGKISDRMQFHTGDALSIFDIAEGDFDIIFNDVDKELYPKVFKKAIPRLKKGGLLISDNALWKGKVLDKNPDAATAGVLTYTRLAYSSRELFNTIIPLRDGVIVSVKL
ncbi:MAG: O-methyltransferase [Bacteroidota bacterium]|nr:O-methyltransferase [Bacteroidota bacterium]